MSEPTRISLHLELDLGKQPIEGEVGAPGGPSHPFFGWLGLVGALERIGRRGPADDQQPTQEDQRAP